MRTRRKARKEEQEIRKGQFPHLPREIWEKICKLVPTKDIAGSLGPSCMALHGLPVESIHMSIDPSISNFDSPGQGFHWLMKHIHGATQVTYISGPLYGCQAISQPHKKLDIIRKQGFEALPHLQMLRVLDVDNRQYEWVQWLRALLKLAPNLVALQLQLPRSPDLPAMAHLRHLILRMSDTYRGLPPCIASLQCLETLALSSSPTCSTHSPFAFQLPASLKHLCINHMLPSGLGVPPGCKVTMMGRSCCLDNCMAQHGWARGRAHVTKLVAHMVDESFEVDESIIGMLPNLEALTLIGTEPIQTLEDPGSSHMMEDLYVQTLPGRQLKHLTSLTICAASICVTIPASLCLTRLCLCATYKLCLHFDSAEESARHLQAFDITCLYLLHQEPIKALQTALQAKGLCLMWDRVIHMQHIRSTPRQPADTCWYRECGCVCCGQCLAGAGVALMQGPGLKSQLPVSVAEITQQMGRIERACAAIPWQPYLSRESPPGVAGAGQDHMCIEDEDGYSGAGDFSGAGDSDGSSDDNSWEDNELYMAQHPEMIDEEPEGHFPHADSEDDEDDEELGPEAVIAQVQPAWPGGQGPAAWFFAPFF